MSSIQNDHNYDRMQLPARIEESSVNPVDYEEGLVLSALNDYSVKDASDNSRKESEELRKDIETGIYELTKPIEKPKNIETQNHIKIIRKNGPIVKSNIRLDTLYDFVVEIDDIIDNSEECYLGQLVTQTSVNYDDLKDKLDIQNNLDNEKVMKAYNKLNDECNWNIFSDISEFYTENGERLDELTKIKKEVIESLTNPVNNGD